MKLSTLLTLSVSLLLAMALYVRSLVIFGVNGTSLVLALSAALVPLLVLRFIVLGEPRASRRILPYLLLAVVVLLSVVINALVYEVSVPALLAGVEILVSVLLPVIAFLAVRSVQQVSTVLHWTLAAATAINAYFLYAAVTSTRSLHRLTALEQVSAFAATNHLAHAIGVSFVVAATGVLVAATRRAKLLYAIPLVMTAPTLLLIGSRSAILGVLLALAVLWLTARMKHRRALVALGVIGAVTLALNYLVVTVIGADRLSLLTARFSRGTVAGDLSHRLFRFTDPLTQIGTHRGILDPFFGVGLDRYLDSLHELQVGVSAAILDPHNIVISTAVFVGIPAGALLVWIILRLLLGMAREWRAARTPLDRFVAGSTLSSVLVATIYASSSGRLSRILTVWILMGLAERVVLASRQRRRRSHHALTDGDLHALALVDGPSSEMAPQLRGPLLDRPG